jgi:hypothetical protein
VNVEHKSAVAATQLFAPHVLLPAQMARSAPNRWLRRLYGAILEDALDCLTGKGPASQPDRSGDKTRRRREALAWIMADTETCFSFLTICTVLELNIEAVRAEARRRVGVESEMPPMTGSDLQ